LVARIAAGSATAAVELMRRYEETVILPQAYRTLGNSADSEDVRSELVVRLLDLSMKREQRSHAEWPSSHVAKWLGTVVKRLAVDMKRRRDAECDRRVHESTWLAKESTPYQQAEVHELARRIEEGLHSLPEKDREAIQMLICRDMPVDVACKAAGVSRATLYRRRDRALAQLRQSSRLRRLFQDSFGP
jgi:RNA polymerase sigma factor (sigma-70 family)